MALIRLTMGHIFFISKPLSKCSVSFPGCGFHSWLLFWLGP